MRYATISETYYVSELAGYWRARIVLADGERWTSAKYDTEAEAAHAMKVAADRLVITPAPPSGPARSDDE